MEWTHGAGVAQALVGSFLPTKVGEGIETVCVVKALLVLTMATFHLSVVPGRIGADELCAVCPAVWPLPQRGGQVALAMGKAIGERKAVIGLDTLHGNAFAGKMLDDFV